MFTVQRLRTVHTQWTIGEFTYAYMRVMRASDEQRFMIANATRERFQIYLPVEEIPLPVDGHPVPIRISVHHPFDVEPRGMSKPMVLAVAHEVFKGVIEELANECPERVSCVCSYIDAIKRPCGSALSTRGNSEFTIAGMFLSN